MEFLTTECCASSDNVSPLTFKVEIKNLNFCKLALYISTVFTVL